MNPWERHDHNVEGAIGGAVWAVWAAGAGWLIILTEIARRYGPDLSRLRNPALPVEFIWIGAAFGLGVVVFVILPQLGPRDVGNKSPGVAAIILFAIAVPLIVALLVAVVGIIGWIPMALWATALHHLGRHPDPTLLRRIGADLMLIVSVPVFVTACSVVGRVLFLWKIAWRLDAVPRSTIRSAAVGPVEIHGKARSAAGEPFILDSSARHRLTSFPFVLEDETGRIRVEPPRAKPARDPRLLLDDAGTLKDGDDVVVVGFAEIDPQADDRATGPDRLRIVPWRPPLERLVPGLAQGGRFEVLSVPDFFLLSKGTEPRTGGRLLRARLLHTFGGAVLVVGTFVAGAAAFCARFWPEALTGFRVFE